MLGKRTCEGRWEAGRRREEMVRGRCDNVWGCIATIGRATSFIEKEHEEDQDNALMEANDVTRGCTSDVKGQQGTTS